MILHSSGSVLTVNLLICFKGRKMFWRLSSFFFILFSDSVFVYSQFMQAAVLTEVNRPSSEMKGQSNCV